MEFATLQLRIFSLHDEQRFRDLAKTVRTLQERFGFSYTSAERAGRLVSKAYEAADDAEAAWSRGDVKGERSCYETAVRLLAQAEEVLGLSVSIADDQVAWWKHYRHRRKLRFCYRLFLHHARPLRLRHLPQAIILTYYLIGIGKAHKVRDEIRAKKFAARYWEVALPVLKAGRFFWLG